MAASRFRQEHVDTANHWLNVARRMEELGFVSDSLKLDDLEELRDLLRLEVLGDPIDDVFDNTRWSRKAVA